MATRHQRRRAAEAKFAELMQGLLPANRAYDKAAIVKHNLATPRGERSPKGLGNRSLYQGGFAATAKGGWKRLEVERSDHVPSMPRSHLGVVTRKPVDTANKYRSTLPDAVPWRLLEPPIPAPKQERGSLVTDDMLSSFAAKGGKITKVK